MSLRAIVFADPTPVMNFDGSPTEVLMGNVVVKDESGNITYSGQGQLNPEQAGGAVKVGEYNDRGIYHIALPEAQMAAVLEGDDFIDSTYQDLIDNHPTIALQVMEVEVTELIDEIETKTRVKWADQPEAPLSELLIPHQWSGMEEVLTTAE